MTVKGGEPTAASPTADIETEAENATLGAEASTAAESSNADEQDANEPADLLSVVRSAVEPEDGPAKSSDAEGETEKPEAKAEADADQADADSEADDANLPFHNHPRWKQVVHERNELRPDAERYRNITGFMEQSGLTGEEVADGFDVMAQLKSGDPAQLTAALEWLEPRVNFLKEQLGQTLPDDLREKVESGLIDEDTANEAARDRAAAKLHTERAKARETTDTEAEASRQRQVSAQAMLTAVEDWEGRTRKADPDYASKAELIEVTCQAIVRRTGQAPKTPEDAVKLAEQAKAEVDAKFKAALPKPRQITPTPRGSSAKTVTEPKTLREAIAGSLATTG